MNTTDNLAGYLMTLDNTLSREDAVKLLNDKYIDGEVTEELAQKIKNTIEIDYIDNLIDIMYHVWRLDYIDYHAKNDEYTSTLINPLSKIRLVECIRDQSDDQLILDYINISNQKVKEKIDESLFDKIATKIATKIFTVNGKNPIKDMNIVRQYIDKFKKSYRVTFWKSRYSVSWLCHGMLYELMEVLDDLF